MRSRMDRAKGQDEAINKDQMTTTLRGHVLDWYMKFSIVPT